MNEQDNCAALKLALHIHAGQCKAPGCIALGDLREFFADLHEYLDDRADVDEPEPGHQIPNAAMRLMVRADHIRLALGVEDSEQAALGAVGEGSRG